MMYKAKLLKGFKLNSLDGEIGKVSEFYFDDNHWAIRYLVVDTGDWLTDRQVLISPNALLLVNKEQQSIDVNLTKKQIEDSPSLNSDKPVSRQFEEAYYGYYRWPVYWDGINMSADYPYIRSNIEENKKSAIKNEKKWDSHLRSTHDVSGHNIQATDGEIGHVDDFIIDDETWVIRYMVVDTRNWWPGKKILVSPKWIKRISWDESKVYVKLSREVIKQSHEYKEETIVTRDYEIKLHKHYNHKGYWIIEQDKNKNYHLINHKERELKHE